MATLILKEKIPSQFTMVQAVVPFEFNLGWGIHPSEYKLELEPFGHKVDIWNPCRVTFHSGGALIPYLEMRDDGEILIEMGYAYRFGLAEQPAPPPEPEPIPEPPPIPEPSPIPTPSPAPPVPIAEPYIISIVGARDVTEEQLELILWGTTDAVWRVPPAWKTEAWQAMQRILLDRINAAVTRGDYHVEHLTRG